MNREKKKRKLWSLPRITDPRYPGFLVRITELEPGGNLYVVRMVDGKQRMASLKAPRKDFGPTKDEQERAVRAKALDLIEELAKGSPRAVSPPEPGERLTLKALADLYELHGFYGRSEKYRKEQPKRVRQIVEFLGAEREVRSLGKSDIERYAEARRAEGVGQGTVCGDVAALKIALNWAMEHPAQDGRFLLEANPIVRVKVAHEQNPKRPVADEGRYKALKKVAPQLPRAFELALDLAWGTGHRIGAILGLRWEDILFDPTEQCPFGRIRWRAEFDKVGNEHETPMNSLARQVLLRRREERPGIGAAWIFPAPKDASERLDRHLVGRWLRKAEEKAELTHLPGGGWHAFRRGWATARKHFPLKDVAEAGGWKDTASLQRSYTHTDPRTVFGVVNG